MRLSIRPLRGLLTLLTLLGGAVGVSDDVDAGVDLRQGAVFSMSNARDGNPVAAGRLPRVVRSGTGGTGFGLAAL